MKTYTFLTLAFIALITGAAIAASVINYVHEMTATISSVTLQRILDNVPLADDEAIPWGTVDSDTTYAYDNFTVLNTGNTAVNVTVITSGLPAGWTLTWLGNNTALQPTEWVESSLELYVASDAVSGQLYTWTISVNAEE